MGQGNMLFTTEAPRTQRGNSRSTNLNRARKPHGILVFSSRCSLCLGGEILFLLLLLNISNQNCKSYASYRETNNSAKYH